MPKLILSIIKIIIQFYEILFNISLKLIHFKNISKYYSNKRKLLKPTFI